jgi:hypothetical protein
VAFVCRDIKNKTPSLNNTLSFTYRHKALSRCRIPQQPLKWSFCSWVSPLWSEFLATDPEVRVLFPAVPDFQRGSGSGTGSTQPLSTTVELLGRKCSGSGLGSREYGRRDPQRWPRDNPLSAKVDISFADKRQSLGQCSKLADSGHRVCCLFLGSNAGSVELLYRRGAPSASHLAPFNLSPLIPQPKTHPPSTVWSPPPHSFWLTRPSARICSVCTSGLARLDACYPPAKHQNINPVPIIAYT